MKLSQFFKKREKNLPELDELDKALALGLITKEEFLRLRLDRAEKKYKDFLKEQKK